MNTDSKSPKILEKFLTVATVLCITGFVIAFSALVSAAIAPSHDAAAFLAIAGFGFIVGLFACGGCFVANEHIDLRNRTNR